MNGHASSDTFNVTPSGLVRMFIDGGDPIGGFPGDVISIDTAGAVTFNAGPETDEGSVVVTGAQPVSFDHIEFVAVTGAASAQINGTNEADAITVAATSTLAGTDGEQDFRVSVNAGPLLLFIDVPSLAIFAQGGSDEVTLQAPAPNNAIWDVDVTVDGGPPAAASDQLIVQTPGGLAETVVYTPTTPDGGTLELTSISSNVFISGIEALTYDGQGDDDSLTIVGTAGPDTIVHTPGATDEAGSLQVNGLLALSYLNLGSDASLTVDGDDGTDTLVYTGTAANDLFTVDGAGLVGGAGVVSLNTRLDVNTTGIETLTLEGLAGDDTFTLLPAISASVYQTLNFNGGGQASATGDQVILVGTDDDDIITISGQVVSLGGRTVNSSGVEDISLDAMGDEGDVIIYNGVEGVTENIVVSSSGLPGGGQISVPGVTLIDFSNVERIDVNGNLATATETDTLTFAGTNANDRFEIDLAAAATNDDPILTLWNNGDVLLTLRSYTFFDTLRVLGLEGTDTFNVYTAASGPSRNLFVDGGLPTGKKKSTDDLHIFYEPPRPHIIHSQETQNPQSGIVDLDYDTAQYVVQYADIEQVTIRRS